MRFDQLPMGALVSLGSKPIRPWELNSPRIELKWHKVGPEKLLASTSIFARSPHSPEVSGVCNFYPGSILHQDLQKIDKFFSEQEFNALQPFTINVAVPRPLRREYGTMHQCSVIAALPALSELIDLDCLDYVPSAVVKEDEPFFPGNNRPDPLHYISQLTRTGSGLKSYRYAYGHDQFNSHKTTRHTGIRPVISVRGSTEFMYNGETYVLVEQEFMLDDELLSCLV